jgi:phosphohistidine phosphatase
MRHSKAEPSGIAVDFERELTPSGRKKAINACKKLTKKGCAVDFILSSSALRAKQTAEIVRDHFGVLNDIIFDEELYYISAAELVEYVQEIPLALKKMGKEYSSRAGVDNFSVMIVGHEPAVSGAAYKLLDNSAKIKPEVGFGLSTANIVNMKSELPWEEWTPESIQKANIIHVEC